MEPGRLAGTTDWRGCRALASVSGFYISRLLLVCNMCVFASPSQNLASHSSRLGPVRLTLLQSRLSHSCLPFPHAHRLAISHDELGSGSLGVTCSPCSCRSMCPQWPRHFPRLNFSRPLGTTSASKTLMLTLVMRMVVDISWNVSRC